MMEESGSDEYALIADLYDSVVPYRDRQDVAFYVQSAVQSGGSVLEIGCGTGRVLIPTAAAGVEITGLDRSARMLTICRERLRQESHEAQSRVQLVESDMRAFDLSRRFNLITMPFRPFQHLTTVAEQRARLACIHSHLASGGRFILDVFNPYLEALVADDVGKEAGDEPEFTMPDGRRVVRRQKVVSKDRASQINHIDLIYYVTFPDGRQERLVHPVSMRYLFRFEAEHLLERCGFHAEEVYSDYDRSPFGSKCPGELLIVARKAG